MTKMRTRGKRLPWRFWTGYGVPQVLYMVVDPIAFEDIVRGRGTIPTGLLTHLYVSWERARDMAPYGRDPIVMRVDAERLAGNGALLIPREGEFMTNAGIPLSLMERLPGNPVTHRMYMDTGSMDTISKGGRRIVMDLFDDEDRMVHPGDSMIFIDTERFDEIATVVKDVAWFPSFKELYDEYPKEDLGYDEDEEASYLDMLMFHSLEEQYAHGVVALEVEIQRFLSDGS